VEEVLVADRDEFYAKIPSFWDRLYGEEYALFDCMMLPETRVHSIKQATEEVYSIYKKVTQIVRNAPDETLLDLGFPTKALPFLRMKTIPYETVIGRFDFVDTNEGLKLLEFNSDTPTFIREVFDVNGLVGQEFNLPDPNSGEEEYLGEAIRNSVYHCAQSIGVTWHPYVVFTAHEDDIEDRGTMLYLMQVSKIKGAAFVPIDQIQIIAGEGVFDSSGNKIDILYRHTYPLEALLEDVSSDDQFPIGIEFMNLVKEQKVGMLNPASAFLMQSKALMAAIWGMYEHKHPLLTEYEHEVIARCFLPTYLDEEPFLEKGERYVQKPAFGREGNTVEVREMGNILFEPKEKSYDHYLKVFQKYVELPRISLKTEKGTREAHMLIGSFVINEKPSAFGIRAGEQITDNLSYFLPCWMKGVNPWT
jgi:glutathionylspermidine synthase